MEEYMGAQKSKPKKKTGDPSTRRGSNYSSSSVKDNYKRSLKLKFNKQCFERRGARLKACAT